MGLGLSQQSISVPVAGDYLQMLSKLWNTLSRAPQFNEGCRKLFQDAPETGMGDMSPVEQEMAALPSLGPEQLTANPRCPAKGYDKTNLFVCWAYNAATRAGNALTILLAALRRTANPEDQDTNLIDSTLVTHSQLIRGIVIAMSSAMMS